MVVVPGCPSPTFIVALGGMLKSETFTFMYCELLAA